MPSAIKTSTIGKNAEVKASDFLTNKQYVVLETNYRYKNAEIDLIVSKNNTLVFVEVKYRKNTKYGTPESFVTHAKQLRLQMAAEQYIYDKNWKGSIRFDIISIVDHEIYHFEDVF